MAVGPNTRYIPADRMALVKRAEALIVLGASIGTASQATNVKYGTLQSWLRRYGRMAGSGIVRLRLLEPENLRLRRSLLNLESA